MALRVSLLKAITTIKTKERVSRTNVLIPLIVSLEQFQELKLVEQMVKYEVLKDLLLQDFQQVLEMQSDKPQIRTQKLED